MSQLINACLMDIDHRKIIPLNINRFLPPQYDTKCSNEITIAIIKSRVSKAIEKNGKGLVKKGYLFGSYSRSEQTPKSDIDIRLEADEGLNIIDVVNIRQDLVDSLGKDVDLLVIDSNILDLSFYKNIKKEICIYER